MLSVKDKQLLAQLQNRFPLAAEPYAVIARRLRMRPEQVLETAARFKRNGVIRYIGATFDLKKAGCVSTLAALQVPPSRIEKTAAYIAAIPRITHNYLRPGRLNMWFTLSGRSAADNSRLIESIRRDCRLPKALDLPTEKVFKIDTAFDLGSSGVRRPDRKTAAAGCSSRKQAMPVSSPVLGVLSQELPLTGRPFDRLAVANGLSRQQALAALKKYAACGLIRRYGAVLGHRRIGLRSNVMAAWKVDPRGIEEFGRSVSALPAVSHCYLRLARPGWPYNLYTMVHGRSPAECRRIIALISAGNKHTIRHCKLLPTLRELKKTRADLRCLLKGRNR